MIIVNVLDIGIILFILLGTVIGLKRGFTKQLVHSIGFIVIVILSFILKNPISIFFYEHLPFFQFTGVLKGVTALNIVIYEMLAFCVVFFILTILYQILLLATSIFEKILTATIILGIPSKILGACLGFIQYFIFTFIILYIVSFPCFSSDVIKKSQLKDPILKHTPILSKTVESSLQVIDDFEQIKKKYQTIRNPKQFNQETIDLLLKYQIITIDSLDYLIDHQKININKQDAILEKYRKEEK